MDDPLIKITESPTQAAIRWSKRALAAEAKMRPSPMHSAPRDEMLYLVLRDGTERGRWRWTSGGAEGWSVNEVWVEPIGWWPVPTTTEAQIAALKTTAAGGSGNLMVDTKSGIVDPMGVNPTPGGSEWQEHGEGWSDEAMLAGGSEGEPDA